MNTWRKIGCCLVAALAAFGALGATYRVTPDASGGGNGLAWADDGAGNAPMTLAAAIAGANTGDTVLLKTGTYTPTATLSIKGIALRGGLAGTDDTACSSTNSVSVLDGQDTLERIVNVAGSPVVCERIEFARAKKQAFYSGDNSRDIKLCSCRFVGNGLAADYGNSYDDVHGGRALYVKCQRPDVNATSLMCSNCVFAGNAARDTSHYIGLPAVSLLELAHADFYDCQFVTNGVAWSYPLGQSNLETVKGGALLVYDSLVSLTRCSFVGNRSLSKENYDSGRYPAGVVALWYSYSTAFKWTCGITNCLFVGNEGTVSKNAGNILQGSNGGALNIYCANCAGGTAYADIVGCTFAYNLFNTTASSAGLNLSAGNAKIKNCIFYGNRLQSATGSGADLRLSGSSGKVEVDYSLFTADATTCISANNGTTLTKGKNLVYGDPKFVTTLADFDALVKSVTVGSMSTIAFDPEKLDEVLAMNVHVTEALSPAVDTGDPASEWSREPDPNGERVNLGVYGNTPEAHVSSAAVQPEIVEGSVDVTFPYGTSQPEVAFTLGGPDGAHYAATATILWSTNGTDWVTAWQGLGLDNGTEVDEILGFCVATGSPLQIKVTVSCNGTETREKTKGFDSVDYPCPPSWGKGGGAGVIHVRSGATGDGSGSDWFNAMATVPASFAPGTKEIWIGEAEWGGTYYPWSGLAVRGGFAGTENSPDERKPGARTVLDCENTRDGLTIPVSGKVVLDGFEIVRAKTRGLNADMGTGCQFHLINCRIAGCGTTVGLIYSEGGRGLWVHNAYAAKGTLVCSNCVFEGNAAATDTRYMGMAAVLVSVQNKATFTDCLFATNGVAWSYPIGKKTMNTASGGAALFVDSTCLEMTRCSFVGNRSLASPDYDACDYPAGVVQLRNRDAAYGMTCGITNCLFIGNEETAATKLGDVSYESLKGRDAGALAIYDAAAKSTFEIVNCTFAYNLVNTTTGAAGLSVRKGKVKVRNSIFYGNRQMASAVQGADLWVNDSVGTVDVDYSLFTSLTTNSIAHNAGSTLTLGDHVRAGDPLFVTRPGAFDKLVSTVAVDGVDTIAFAPEAFKDVMAFDVHVRRSRSKAVDTGDPASAWANEPKPNGRCVNLGAYGNTSEAARSPGGLVLFVK